MPQDDDFEAKLAAIRLSYLNEGLPEQLQAVVLRYDEFMGAAHNSENLLDALAPLHAAAHKLAGSSGTFGLPDTAAFARSLSDYTDKNSPEKPSQQDDFLENIRLMVIELQKSVATLKSDL